MHHVPCIYLSSKDERHKRFIYTSGPSQNLKTQKMESEWQDNRRPHVLHINAERDPTHVTRPPPPAEDPLELPQSPSQHSRWCRLHTKK